jgi:valyl-tRNA synthetase
VANGDIQFYPDRWAKVYDHWLANIKDWCISRQLWWGHRVPVWYRGDEIYCGITPPKGDGWTQDNDVLDTWCSSWLWPFATMGWPEKTDTLKKFYPTTDLVTGPDIIFFWVARMIMAGHEFMGEKPFSNVYFTGIIRDAIGRKMSKSLGNSPDPLDLIAKYGADGLRFGLMLIAPQGQDILFDEKRCEVGRNFMNKVWNAARFIQMQRASNPPAATLSIHDRKILFEANDAITKVSAALDGYRFSEAAKELYEFVWSDFCDWYIETSKASPNLVVLDGVFSIILRLLHPFAPHITEELWHGMGYELRMTNDESRSSIQFAQWPNSMQADAASPELAAKVDALYNVIRAGRQLRSEYKIEPQKKVRFAVKPNADEEFFRSTAAGLKLLLGAEEVEINCQYAPKGVTPSAVTPAATIFMVGAVEVTTEKARLTKELDKARKDLDFIVAKLNNPSFRDRAPANVVAEQEQRKAETEERIQKLEAAIAALG